MTFRVSPPPRPRQGSGRTRIGTHNEDAHQTKYRDQAAHAQEWVMPDMFSEGGSGAKEDEEEDWELIEKFAGGARRECALVWRLPYGREDPYPC